VISRRRSALVVSRAGIDELFAAAERAAALLEMGGVRHGDRVLLSLGEPRLFAAWFLGMLGRGIVPVPLPPFGGLGTPASHHARIAAVTTDCAPRLAVIAGQALSADNLAGVPAPDAIDPRAADTDGPRRSLIEPPLEAVAFLQYTSGSTGSPKGVVVTHANLAANLASITSALGVAVGDRMISWLPLHHDMGLIGGLLWPVVAGIDAYVMTPLTFLSRPAAWLEAISLFRGTITLAPNFGYSLCARKLSEDALPSVDLSSLRLALCGAEPIDVNALRAFQQKFSPRGFEPTAFLPVYGLAEATLAVAFHERGAEVIADTFDRDGLVVGGRVEKARSECGQTQTVVSVGSAVPGVALEIVSPVSGAPCGDREVGEVVVTGSSVTPRYWSDAGAARTRLHTGDLGYVADGRLFLVDRLKDIIIVGGANYAPSDIEACVNTVEGVRFGCSIAFGSRDVEAGTEKVVIVCEIDPKESTDPPRLREVVAARVRDRCGLTPQVAIVAPGTLEKTTSGKVRRRACRDRYEAGALDEIGCPKD
jgi:acyl-CoA synthetase (AMP-forming)/AMP-acid ligase II